MSKDNIEIERKWLMSGFPEQLMELGTLETISKQGYISCGDIEVRIREKWHSGYDRYFITFKGSGKIIREEIEFEIDRDNYLRLKRMIEKPMIVKHNKNYAIGKEILEVNLVDEGTENEFYYAEIEFETLEEAENFELDLPEVIKDVTYDSEYKIKNYWKRTRCT